VQFIGFQLNNVCIIYRTDKFSGKAGSISLLGKYFRVTGDSATSAPEV
jgi:hypothetical protein